MRISAYKHPFAARPENETILMEPGHSLQWYLERCGANPQHGIVIRNGGIIPTRDLPTYYPSEGDDIIFRPLIHGGNAGKQALNILVAVAVVVGSFFLGPAGAALTGVWLALAVGGVAAAGAAISTFAIGPPKNNAQADTPTYGWQGPQTLAQQGVAIPIPIGNYPTSGNVIASFVESINDKQYLNALVSLGLGPAVAVNTIKINNNDIAEYSNATFDVRLGKNTQDVCANFNNLVNTDPVDERILAGPGSYPVVVNGTRNDTQAFEVEFYFPSGLWAGPNSDGSYDPWAVTIMVEYQFVGAPSWTTYIVPGVTNPVGEVAYWLGVVQDYRYDDGRQVVVQTEDDPTKYYQGETFQINLLTDPVDSNNVQQVPQTITVTGYWTKNPNNPAVTGYGTGTTYVTPGSWTTATCSFGSNEGQTPKRFVFSGTLPEKGQYNWRFTKLGSSQYPGQTPELYSDDDKLFETYVRRGEQTWVYAVREISYEEFTYPNHILLALRVCATDQLSGGNLQLSAMVEADNPETQGYVHAVRWDQPTTYFRLAEALGATSAVDLMGKQPSGSALFGTSGITINFQQTSLIQNSPDYCIQVINTGTTPLIDDIALASADDQLGLELLLQPDAATIWGSSTGPNPASTLSTARTLSFYIIQGNSLSFGVDGDGKLFIETGDGSNRMTGSTPLVPGETCHIGLVVDANQLCTFILNGVVDTQMSFPIGDQSSSSLSLLAGFTGYVDEISLYDLFPPQLGRVRKHYLDSVSDHNALEAFPANIHPVIATNLITNTLYGGSLSPSLIDVPWYTSWANRCMQNIPDGAGGLIQRFEYNGVIDSISTLWDALTNLSHSGGASMLRTGFYFSGVLDAPGNPKRLINIAQVMKGTFQEAWSSVDDRANSIDVIYYDELNFYARAVLTVQNQTLINAGSPIIKAAQVDLRGCTKIARAWHYGNFVLKSSATLMRTLKFQQPLDSLSTWPGEVILIQHDLPSWGMGGKLLSGNTLTTVIVDQDLTDYDTDQTYTMIIALKLCPILEGIVITNIRNNAVYFSNVTLTDTDHSQRFVCGANDYGITSAGASWVQLDNVAGLSVGMTAAIYCQNYMVQRDIGSYNPITRTVTLNGALPVVPQEFDSWTMGSVLKGQPEPFHVMSITRQKDLSAELTLIEYQDSVYTDDDPQLSPGVEATDIAAMVTGLLGNEVLSPTGAESTYAVSWQWGSATQGALVYTSINGSAEVLFADAGVARSIYIPVNTTDVILVRVVGYDANKKSAPYGSSPTVTNTIAGTSNNPTNITGFGIGAWDLVALTMELAWNASPESNIESYLISYFSDYETQPSQADCDNNLIATINVGTTTYSMSSTAYKGKGTYAIRAVNTKGFYSIEPSVVRAYSLDDVQPGLDNKTRTAGTGPMIVVPAVPFTLTAITGGLAQASFFPFTMNTGAESISVLTGSSYVVTGLTQGQSYYFYYDDPSFLGGNVTIHATQDVNVLSDPAAQGGRFIINQVAVLMPVGAGGPGGTGGGSGTVTGIIRPTTWVLSDGSCTPLNPTYAYDGNSTTYAQLIYAAYYTDDGGGGGGGGAPGRPILGN